MANSEGRCKAGRGESAGKRRKKSSRAGTHEQAPTEELRVPEIFPKKLEEISGTPKFPLKDAALVSNMGGLVWKLLSQVRSLTPKQ